MAGRQGVQSTDGMSTLARRFVTSSSPPGLLRLHAKVKEVIAVRSKAHHWRVIDLPGGPSRAFQACLAWPKLMCGPALRQKFGIAYPISVTG